MRYLLNNLDDAWALTLIHLRLSLVPIVLTELGERSSQPHVVAERGSPSDRANHEAGNVRCVRHSVERTLWAGNDETSEGSALYTSTNLRCPVLKSPCQGRIEIITRLNSGRRESWVTNNKRQCERKREMRRKTVAH